MPVPSAPSFDPFGDLPTNEPSPPVFADPEPSEPPLPNDPFADVPEAEESQIPEPANPFSEISPPPAPAFDPFAEPDSNNEVPPPAPGDPFDAPPPPSFDPFAEPQNAESPNSNTEDVPLGDVFGDPPPATGENPTPPSFPDEPPPPPAFDPFDN